MTKFWGLEMIVMIDDYDKYAKEHPEVKITDKWETHGIKFAEVEPKKTRKRKKP